MFLSYCMVFTMSLSASPSWRLMLGVLSIPSWLYFALTVFYLPESPRWFVSKGRMLEAKQVLQSLRGMEDVSGTLENLLQCVDQVAKERIKKDNGEKFTSLLNAISAYAKGLSADPVIRRPLEEA